MKISISIFNSTLQTRSRTYVVFPQTESTSSNQFVEKFLNLHLSFFLQGVTYPCIHAVWARWAPPLERSRMATLAFSGSYVGTVVAMPACAYLAEGLGWPSIFYVFGKPGSRNSTEIGTIDFENRDGASVRTQLTRCSALQLTRLFSNAPHSFVWSAKIRAAEVGAL